MRTKEYIYKIFDGRSVLTAFKRAKETYTDDGQLYKWRVEDHLRQMVEEGEKPMDSNGYLADCSNDLYTVRTEKDEQGRFTLIELTYRKEPKTVYRSTKLSYYPDGRLYQKVEETTAYREENTYTYLGVVTQIESVMQYKDIVNEDLPNDVLSQNKDYREVVWRDSERILVRQYDIVTNRLTVKEFMCSKRTYHYRESYDEDGTTHTFCVKEKQTSDYVNHIYEYNDGVLLSDELVVAFLSEDKKRMWFMQQTIDHQEKTHILDRIGYIKMLSDDPCSIQASYSLY